ncbi:hypothetical protein FXW07_01820 [Methanosarcina sp. DH1]|uniref:hypothetical protein n=1 Tax=Methanosarcina sp. DH1 TaxID=2605695 RepID=UPI001E63A67A|nr:hypothetical protein [Methanosarcina sp. DH1]MCC4765409.1 hypothetical protein [Methanosarcina sp. DH1]
MFFCSNVWVRRWEPAYSYRLWNGWVQKSDRLTVSQMLDTSCLVYGLLSVELSETVKLKTGPSLACSLACLIVHGCRWG